MQSLKAQGRDERAATNEVAAQEHQLGCTGDDADDDLDDLDEASRAEFEREFAESIKESEAGQLIDAATHVAQLRALIAAVHHTKSST